MAQSFPVRDVSDAVVGKAEAGMAKVFPAGTNDPSFSTTYEYPDAFQQQDRSDNTNAGSIIQSARYPLKDEGDHFIRFFINLNEESKLIKRNLVQTTGYVDNRDQNRANTNSTDINAVSGAIGATGAALGALGAASLGIKAMRTLFRSKVARSGVVGGAALVSPSTANAGISDGGQQINSILSEDFGLQNKLKRLAANITLYTPAEVRSNYSFEYDVPEDVLVTLAQSQNYEALKTSLNQVGAAVTGIGSEGAMEKLGVAGGLLTAFGRIITAKNETVSLLSRTALNPRRDVLFRYVGNRQFQFNFVFAPRSAEEAREVYNIIYLFKYFSHPEMLPGYGNFLYLYPAEFDIEYGLRIDSARGDKIEERNRFINKISSCVVDNISVDYAPGGSFQSLQDGEPVITTLGISFREIETLHRDRIAQGDSY